MVKPTERAAPEGSPPSLKHVLIANAAMLAAAILAGCASLVDLQPVHVLSPHVTTRELVEMRQLSGLTLSPDGRLAVVRVEEGSIAGNAIDLSWNVIDLTSGRVTRVAGAGEPRLFENGNVLFEIPQWSPDSQWIYYRAIVNQQSQVWRTKYDGSATEQLTFDAADVMNFQVGPSGVLYYMTGGATRADILAAESDEFDHGVLLDRTIVKGLQLLQSFPINGRMAALRADLPDAMGTRGPLLSDRPVRAVTFDLATRQTVPAAPAVAEKLLESWKAGFGLTYLPSNLRAGNATLSGRIAEVDRNVADPSSPDEPPTATLSWRGADAAAVCTHAACKGAHRLAIIGWIPDRAQLVFEARTDGITSVNVWDTVADAVRTLAEGPEMYGAYGSGTQGVCQIAMDQLICIKAGPDLPPRIVSIDPDNGRETVLFNPNPHLSPERLGTAKVFVIHDSFGNSTVVRAILPRVRANTSPLPLVLTNYTCQGFLEGGSGKDVPEHVLAGMGYATACIDLGNDARRKLSFEMSQTNGDRNAGEWFEAAARKLVEDGIADPERVGLTGFSGGATAAAKALTTSTSFAAAIVTTEPALSANGCYLVAHLGNCQWLARNAGFPAPYDRRDGLLADSPAWNADKVVTPLLMQLPESEYESTLQLWAALRDSGRAVETIVFPEAYHFKSRPRQRLAVYERNIDWLGFWLRPEKHAVSDEKERSRWSALLGKHCTTLADAQPNAAALPHFCRSTRDS